MNQNYKLMKKIVKGNDFTLRIPVMKMVEGQAQAFPLPACTDIVVQVCNQFKRIPLAFEIDVKEDNVLLARVEGVKAGSVIDGLLMYCRKTRRFTTCSRLSCYHFMPFW